VFNPSPSSGISILALKLIWLAVHPLRAGIIRTLRALYLGIQKRGNDLA